MNESENQGQSPWHAQSADEIARQLEVDLQTGLQAEEVDARRKRFGENIIYEKPPRSRVRMFLDQFADFMILVLIAAALVSGVVGDLKDTNAILVIVILNAAIGFIQELRAQKAIAALKKMTAASAKLVRDGSPVILSAAELVPGDVVRLEAGDVVPADMRLFEAVGLKADESLLTGESVTVDKIRDKLPIPDLPIGERFNMTFKGTVIASGHGAGIVVCIGMQTELGRVAALLNNGQDAKTPLQKRLAKFGARLGVAVLAICAVIFLAGLMRGEDAVIMFLTSVSLAVAAIPEALPAVVTISLALGAQKMIKQNALIRRLPAVETLGSVTYICSDKTGTLTQNKMRVERIFASDTKTSEWKELAGREPWQSLFTAMALCNDTTNDGVGESKGDPTEVAIDNAARQLGFVKSNLAVQFPRMFDIPFDPDRKMMSTAHQTADELVVYVKGAPESVLKKCTGKLTGNNRSEIKKKEILSIAEEMGGNGLRVIAFAKGHLAQPSDGIDAETTERDLTFLGLVGLLDPPRPEAEQSVRLCRSAGIRPVMITGDHPSTASAIARKLGIAEDDCVVLTGPQLAQLPHEQFTREVADISVYARVDPAQKIRIIEALQKKGEFVAMTGDGVNDAPALKRADIGIAMGKGGSDVAREASSLILVDNNFSTIVSAVREGRRIFDNIRKFIKYTMTSNAGEVWTIFLAPFAALPIPLLPIHILWINLVTDGLPGLALTAEKEEKGIMKRPPRPPNESIFSHGMWQHIIWCGLAMGAVALFTQAWAIGSGRENWQTMVFTVLTLSQMGHVLAIRADRDSLIRQGLLSNLPLLWAVLLTFLLQLAVIYTPILNPIFKTAPLSLFELFICLILSSVVFFLVEIEKLLIRRNLIYRT